MLVDLANEQSRSHEITIIIMNRVIDEALLEMIEDGVSVIRIGRAPGDLNPWHWSKLIYHLKRCKPDIIHAHNESLIRVLGLLAPPKVLTVHSPMFNRSADLKKYDAVFSISEAVRNALLAADPGLKVATVYNGIPFRTVKSKRSYGNKPFRIVQAGRLDHRIKGQDILISAIELVLKNGNGRCVSVDIIGEDHGSLAYLKVLMRDRHLENEINFPGLKSRPDFYSCLREYDLLVQPSRVEGFGLTVIEAMAAKVPVLVSDIEGPMEIIGNGRYGSYFHCGSSRDCADKISAVMSQAHEGNYAARMDAIREYAEQKFDISVTARDYLQGYVMN